MPARAWEFKSPHPHQPLDTLTRVAKLVEPQTRSVWDRWFPWILVLLTFLLYAQTGAFPFHNLDDPVFITENPNVLAGLTGKSIAWAWTAVEPNWQPLVFLSHQTMVSIFGLDAGPHHLLNALLHAINGALFYLVLRQLRLPFAAAAAAAAVFTFHPLRVESVAWVTERKDVLSALFWLLTMRSYIAHAEGKAGRMVWVMVWFVLGLMAKPILVTLPVALLILDYWPLRRTAPVRTLLVEKIPMTALAVAAAVATIVTQKAAGAMAALPLDVRVLNAIRSYGVYLGKTLLPTDLSVMYPYPAKWPPAEVAVAALVVLGVSWVAWQRRNTAPWWLAGWAWYLIVVAPNIGLIQVGPQPYADRYTYMPSLLPLAAVAYALEAVAPAALFRAGALAVSAVLFVMSSVQISTWKDDETLYRHAIAAAPGAPVVYRNLGVALEKKGRFNEAIANYVIARDLTPDDPVTYQNLGLAYLQTGRAPLALENFQKWMQLSPDSPTPLYHQSRALLAMEQMDESDRVVKKALGMNPDLGLQASLRLQLGMASYMRKDDEAALREFFEALRLVPEYATARKNAGISLGNLGRTREAIEQFELYLKDNPDDKDVRAVVAALRQGGK